MEQLLNVYRERGDNPAFWAEPANALSNASFLIAALLAFQLAQRRQALTFRTAVLIGIAVAIGLGSFTFHTLATRWAQWLDVGPIIAFLITALWLSGRRLLQLSAGLTFTLITGVVALSLLAVPIKQPFNGSLFYFPAWGSMALLGAVLFLRGRSERATMLIATGVFGIALIARSVDWQVPSPLGTHFVWHLLNGVVVYLVIRTWIIAGEGELRERAALRGSP